MTDLFAALPAEDTGPLRARLAAAAAQHGVLDVTYRTLDSPLGSLLLAATPAGLVTIAYAVQDHDAVLATLASRISPRVVRTGLGLDEAARQIDEYFAGRRHAFDTPIDLRLAHGFRRTVLQHLRQVGYGTTTSYAGLAAAAGSPGAVRAVGTACATNPLPIVVPCHRVIRSDGSPGHYVGGDAAKTALLALETSQETR
jgi:methylated-DNA-[protein]-cysteine S-methyltransferase